MNEDNKWYIVAFVLALIYVILTGGDPQDPIDLYQR